MFDDDSFDEDDMTLVLEWIKKRRALLAWRKRRLNWLKGKRK